MAASLDILQQRSELLQRLRQFFLNRSFVEVETPLLSSEVIPELHIEPLTVDIQPTPTTSRDATHRRNAWLQASPELHMKRLLADGMKAIFQITRSFRAGEQGPLHHPEFTIVEWYRTGDDMQAGIQLLDQLCQQLLSTASAKRTSYAEAFERYVGICPHTSTANQFAEQAKVLKIATPVGMNRDDRDEWLNLLLATRVEPKLGHEAPEILSDYPASLAALAKVERREDGIEVARRFELYWHGIELANGYDELTDANELRTRLESVNAARQADGRQALPLPESLFTAMKTGLPDCAGVALGFDRLVMLACGAESIKEVMPLA